MLPLAESINETANVVKKCQNCGILDTISPCKICSSDTRSQTTICIVEDMADVWAFERSGYHKGLYHDRRLTICIKKFYRTRLKIKPS